MSIISLEMGEHDIVKSPEPKVEIWILALPASLTMDVKLPTALSSIQVSY